MARTINHHAGRDRRAMIEIRPARIDDVPSLPDIERAAASRFAEREIDLGLEAGVLEAGVLDDLTTVEELEAACRAGHLFVAESASDLVGFAYCETQGDDLLLGELDVLPDHGRRGIGRALVETVLAHARETGFVSVVLTTFRDVPWNAPFYRSMGFEVVEPAAWTQAMRDLVRHESERGLSPESRVVMRYGLG